MLTCSNCGAAARPGAKFCTSCGARLPIVQTSETSGWGANGDQSQPSSPWGAAPTNGQQTPSSPEPATVTASAANDQSTASNEAPGGASSSPWGQSSGDQGKTSDTDNPAEPGQSSPSWTWGQPQTDDTAQDDTASTSAPDSGESGTVTGSQPNWISGWTTTSSETGANVQDAAPEATQPASASGDTSVWSPSAASSGNTAAQDSEAIAAEQHGEENANPDARPEWMRNLEAGSQEATSETPLDQTGADFFSETTETSEETAPATARETPSAEPAASASPAAGADHATTDDTGDGHAAQTEDLQAASMVATIAPATTSGVASPAAPSGDALGEAQRLLDRLRDLLPALAAPAAAGADTSGIANQLQQALDQNAKPEFDDLRGVLEAAKERPRDVDTMLNLVAKIDPMLALLHAHGNLLTAISAAVTHLRDQNTGQ